MVKANKTMNFRTVSMMLMAVILAFFSNGTSAQLPCTPCPNIFRYEYTGSGYIGVITLQNITDGQTTVEIEMEQSEILRSVYKGKISLLNTDEKKVGEYINWDQPITYRVDFPLPNVVPRVTEITVNGVKICRSQKDSSSRARFSLTHTLSSPVTTHIPPSTTALPIPSQSANYSYIKSVCGTYSSKDPVNLLVNDQIISEFQLPWVVAIFLWNDIENDWKYTCEGSLVSTRTVITAAHCFYTNHSQMVPLSEVMLVMGQNRPTQTGNGVNLERIIIHPDYRIDKYDADIAILHLNESVTFTNSIRPICLWKGSSNIIEGSVGTVITCGYDAANTSQSDVSQLIDVKIASCRRTEYRTSVTDRILCASMKDGDSLCFGNSGSALMIHNGQKWTLRGVASTLFELSSVGYNRYRHALYSDAARFTNWINLNLML